MLISKICDSSQQKVPWDPRHKALLLYEFQSGKHLAASSIYVVLECYLIVSG